MRNRNDSREFDSRVRRALMDENSGLRRTRHSKVEWRALQAIMAAVAV